MDNVHVNIKPTILILEDDESLRYILKYNFNSIPYNVYDTDCYEEALQIVKQNNIDVVLTDINLQNTNSLSFIRSVKLQYPHIKCIIMSGEIENVYKQNLEEFSDIHFIDKPFSFVDLLQIINNLLDKK